VILTRAELEAIRKQAETEYPSECCGVVLSGLGPEPERELRACRNVQDMLHARDPERFPRDSRTAYYIAHEDLLAIGRRESQGYAVTVIYHSHVDTGAYFSETDRRNALIDTEPVYPQAIYVVLAVDGGRAGDAGAFRWDPSARQFSEVPLDVG